MTKLYVPREHRAGERRVAASPETTKKLVQSGLEVAIERGAGDEAGFVDAAFAGAGATIDASGAGLADADLVFRVAPPEPTDVDRLKPGAWLFALLDPYRNRELLERIAARGVVAFAMVQS